MRRLYTDSQINGLIDNKISGTNDGTNWTKIKINGVEKNIPSGGGGAQIYRHYIYCYENDYESSVCFIIDATSSTAVTNWSGVVSLKNATGSKVKKIAGTYITSQAWWKMQPLVSTPDISASGWDSLECYIYSGGIWTEDTLHPGASVANIISVKDVIETL